MRGGAGWISQRESCSGTPTECITISAQTTAIQITVDFGILDIFYFFIPNMTVYIHHTSHLQSCLSSNGDLDLDARLDVDDDLLDDLGGRIQTAPNESETRNRGSESGGGSLLNQTLMDSHLKAIPGLGTFTAGGFAGGDFEDTGGETDGALDAEVLGLGTLDQVGGNCRVIGISIRGFFWEGVIGVNSPFSRACTLREVRVMRILWILGPSPNSPFSGLLYDIFAEKETKRLLESRLLRVAIR